GVHMLKTIPDANKMMDDLHEEVQNVTVIGGGYIGLEMAESFKMLGKKVRLIHRSPFVGKIFDSDMAQYIHDEAIKHDIELMVNESVTGLNGKDAVNSVETDQSTYSTDLVVISTGIDPNKAFIKVTGINAVNEGEIKTNHYKETNIEDIYATANCALS